MSATRRGCDPELAALAEAYGVATSYEAGGGRRVEVTSETVTAVLAELGVTARTTEEITAASIAAAEAPWHRLIPPTVTVRAGHTGEVVVHGPAGVEPHVQVLTEDGARQRCGPVLPGFTRLIGGRSRLRTVVPLPPVHPGWHRIEVVAGDERAEAVLIAAPERLPEGDRGWGWMVQLYALGGEQAWGGLGDYHDLAELVGWTGEQGGSVVLCNPLHAPSPVRPIENSPYYPSSRRFRNPLYLNVERTPEYRSASPEVRAQVDALRPPTATDQLDRDAVWAAKMAALALLGGRRETELTAYLERHGEPLADFALFCALAEEHGVPWQSWPADLRHPDTARAQASRHRRRIRFHAWLQLLCDEQLDAAATAAKEAGMPIGVMHDLAVGVDAGGADAWGLQDVLATGVTVGAPPDAFSQQGQDWLLPPWRPDALAAAGYAPYRDMLRAILRSAGGLRVDHVLGLFRLWWIPAGRSAAEGTYVRYDAEALLGVLTLEAYRAGAVVVGEDLGTVEQRVAGALSEHDVLGCEVLWFVRDPDDRDRPLPPARWRPDAVASVTTHDLPTAAGFLYGDHVRVRAERGLLADPDRERAVADTDRGALLELLRGEGLLPEQENDPAVVVRAMHALLARTPCRLLLAAPGDAVGDRRQPNLPGTVDEYPNWRLRVTDAAGRVCTREDLADSESVREIVALLTAGTAN